MKLANMSVEKMLKNAGWRTLKFQMISPSQEKSNQIYII